MLEKREGGLKGREHHKQRSRGVNSGYSGYQCLASVLRYVKDPLDRSQGPQYDVLHATLKS